MARQGRACLFFQFGLKLKARKLRVKLGLLQSKKTNKTFEVSSPVKHQAHKGPENPAKRTSRLIPSIIFFRSTCSHLRVVNAIRRSPHRRGLPMAWLFDGHRQQRAGAGIHRITATRGGICALQFHLESSAARFLDPFGEKIRLLSFVTRFWLIQILIVSN